MFLRRYRTSGRLIGAHAASHRNSSAIECVRVKTRSDRRANADALAGEDTRKRRTWTPLSGSEPALNSLAQVVLLLAQVVSTSTSVCWARCSATYRAWLSAP